MTSVDFVRPSASIFASRRPIAASSLAPSAMYARTSGSSGGPAGRLGDARQQLRHRVVRLVRRVEVDEEKEAVGAVRVEPRERVVRDRVGVARAIAVVGEPLEPHVDADGGVAAS